MKRTNLIPLLALALCPGALQAKVIDKNKARTIATRFINPGTQPQMNALKVQGNNMSAPDFYVFNDKSGQGFVLVAGDDCVSPVLGYSRTGKADANNMPPALKAWLESVSQYISTQRQQNGGVAKTRTARVADNPGTPIVEPIVKTHWSQNEPYFNQTPTIQDKHTATCCVATAMAQVFNHYKYPAHGTGAVDYETPMYDQSSISIDFSKSTYDWTNMLDNYTTGDDGTKNWNDAQAAAVSTLMRDIGAALHVSYNTDESGAYTEDMRKAAARNFGYMATTYYKNSYSMKQWLAMLCKRFDEGNPVVITGISKDRNGGGHAFVGDGYDSNNNVHINWGWAGLYDGYYNFYQLGPEPNNFNSNMDFTEFCKDESGQAANKIEQPIVTILMSQLIDSDGDRTEEPIIKMDADKFNCGITILPYHISAYEGYEGKLKIGLYNEDGNTMLGTIGEEIAVKNDYTYNSGSNDKIDIRFKPEDFAGLDDGNYQLVILSNCTNDNDNWVKADNDNIIGLGKSNGSIMLTNSPRDTGHLTQKGAIRFSKDTYELGEIATFSVSLANNSNDDFGGEIYAHLQNVDKEEVFNDSKTNLDAKLFCGNESDYTDVKMDMSSYYGFNPGKYHVTLWQYCKGQAVPLNDSDPATITIVENPKKQPTMFVNKMSVKVDFSEDGNDIDVKPGDIVNLNKDVYGNINLNFGFTWERAEVEPENFSTIACCIVKADGMDDDAISSYPFLDYESLFEEEEDLPAAVSSDIYKAGSTPEFYAMYSLFSVAGGMANAKYLGTDQDAVIKIHWTDEPTDIRSLNSTCTRVVERFNAMGKKLPHAEKGLNIVKYSDGSIRKEIVK